MWYLDLRAGSNFSLNAFRQEICPNLRIPPKAPNSARTHFSPKIIFVFSKKSLRPFTPESRVFPPESRAIPPEFIFPKNTALQCFRLLKLNSARRQIFCPTPPPGRLVWKGRNCSPFEDPGIHKSWMKNDYEWLKDLNDHKFQRSAMYSNKPYTSPIGQRLCISNCYVLSIAVRKIP